MSTCIALDALSKLVNQPLNQERRWQETRKTHMNWTRPIYLSVLRVFCERSRGLTGDLKIQPAKRNEM